MAGEHTAFINRWTEEVWNKGRTDVLDEMMAPDCTVYDDMAMPMRRTRRVQSVSPHLPGGLS